LTHVQSVKQRPLFDSRNYKYNTPDFTTTVFATQKMLEKLAQAPCWRVFVT